MHELAFAQGILRAVEGGLTDAQVGRVARIVVTVGELTLVQKECLEFAFSAVIMGTAIEGAALDIEYVKAVFRCKTCEAEFEPSDGFYTPCPSCGGFGVDVIKGEGLYVKSVELE